jgi:hypothetical protein
MSVNLFANVRGVTEPVAVTAALPSKTVGMGNCVKGDVMPPLYQKEARKDAGQSSREVRVTSSLFSAF